MEWDPESLLGAPGEFVAEPGSGTTFIEGTVVDEEGRPVAGAAVEMHAIPKAGTAFLPPLLHAATVTGADGAFRVGPGPSPWWVQGILSARAPGFARAGLVSGPLTKPGLPVAEEGLPARLVLPRGYPVKGEVRTREGGPPDGPVTVWAVGEGGCFEVLQTDAAGDFTFIAPQGPMAVSALDGVHPGARASLVVGPEGENRVSLQVARGRDIRGKVVDGATGMPVAGAVVRGYYGVTRLFRTGPDGEFLLPRYWYGGFQVRAPGYAVKTHRLADDAGSPGVPPETVRLAPGFVARGKVLDLDGHPLAHARLRFLSRDPVGDWGSSAGPYSGKDGSFVFVGLPLPAPGQEVPLFATASDCDWGVTAPLPGIAGGVLDGVEVRIPRLVDIGGRVEDGAGVPVPARVDLAWDLPKPLAPYGDVFPSSISLLAGDDGVWKVRIPERTPFRIVARGDAFGEAKAEGRSPAFSDPKQGAFAVKVDRGLSIRGSVVDAQGDPVRRGEVRVEPHPPTDPRPSRDARIREDGTFEAGGLAPGPYDFSVLVHPEFLQEAVFDVAAGAPPVKVVLRRPGGLRFHAVVPPDVPEGTAPEVSLRALEDTRPLPRDFDLKLDPYDPRANIGPMSPAAYSLSVTAGDYRADIERVVVGQREATDLGDLELKPGAVVAGTVTMAGVTFPGASVEAIRLLPGGGSRSMRRVTTDATGTFRIGGLLAGSHLLSVRCPDRPLVDLPFEAVTGAVATLDVAVKRGARLRVTVTDAAGAPVGGAHLVFLRDGASVPYWREGMNSPGPHKTAPDGTLRCSGLPEGAILVKAEKPGKGSAEVAVKTEEGGAADVEVRLGK